MNDTETRVNWRALDTTTMEGLQALKREIGLRLGYDADDPLTDDPWKDWQSDLNAAMSLPIESEYYAALLCFPKAENPNERYQGIRTDDVGNDGRGWHESPAVAMSFAWLSWHDAAHAETSDNLSCD